jgi:methylated-DNA-[protein]-cysteine S-methyltransferase
MTTEYATFESPVGELLLLSDGSSVTGLHMQDGLRPGVLGDARRWEGDSGPLGAAGEQLAEYFAGERTQFDLPLAAAGTPFQRRVWAELRAIPYGQTASYGELARRIGSPTASRAVGMANGRNPISIFVPCHRVIGAGGTLTGYAGGVERKRYLLDLEAGSQPLTRAPAVASPPARAA